MSETRINAALVAAYLASGVMPQARTAFEGVTYEPAPGQTWARVTNLPSDRYKPGLGLADSSEAMGILQVDIFHPKGSGTAAILADADLLLTHFEPRIRLTYSGQAVEIRQVRRSGIRIEEVWQSIAVEIYYRANIVQ